MGCCCNDCFSLLAGDFLQVKRDNLGCVSVKACGEFIHQPPLLPGFDELGDSVAVFLAITELAVSAQEKKSIIQADSA